MLLGLVSLGIGTAHAGYKVVDGDSLVHGKEKIRLLGIDAPEYKQTCANAQGDDYPCGKTAKKFLENLLTQGKVSCHHVSRDIYKRKLSVCYVEDQEINLLMIQNGWAVAYRGKNQKYVLAEKVAKQKKKGLWQGKFMRPELYRIWAQ